MKMRIQRRKDLIIGIVSLTIALFISFALSEVALYHNGRRNMGPTLLGIATIFEEFGARYFAVLP